MATPVPPAVLRKYEVENEIARGKFGVVYRCLCKKTKDPCAVKVMLKKGNKRADVEREAGVLRKLNHPSVLQVMDYFECDNEYVLVMELLNGGELFDYVIEKDYLDEAEAMYYMKQILEGLAYVHKKNIVHLDMKPENIVLKDKDAKQLKIIDFGTAQDLTITPNAKAMVGTPEFIAPEVLEFEPVSTASDMWAMGVIAYVLLTGMSPFLGDDDMETITNISQGEFEYPDPDPEEGYEDITQLAKDFIDSLLKLKPKERNTADHSLMHPWITTTTKETAPRFSTSRLKTFRARRRWLATFRALSAVNLLSKLKLAAKNQDGASNGNGSPTTPEDGPNKVFGAMMQAIKAVNIMRRLCSRKGPSSNGPSSNGDVCPTTPTSKDTPNGVFVCKVKPSS